MPSAAGYDRLRKEASLWEAWSSVKQSGRLSNSEDTKKGIQAFGRDERRHLRRIARRLLEHKFEFGKARGVPISRPGKTPRPIVVASIEARIVQRALLDELQRLPNLRPHFINDNSFGGIQKKGRSDAVQAAVRVIGEGAKFFVRSDIRDFFTKIPKQRVFDVVMPLLDAPTQDLLRRAVDVELENANALGSLLRFFPDEDRGVAQGLCLSPLFGNILLAEFDRRMNDRRIRCLRYVDDFLLLADRERNGLKAFDSALQILKDLGLTAYDPREDSAKAEFGPTSRPFDFLGCTIQPGLVAPSKNAKARMLAKVDERLGIGRTYIHQQTAVPDRRASFVRVMADVGNIVHGWRESFDFCPEAYVFDGVDHELTKRIDDFVRRFANSYLRADVAVRRAQIGVPSLGRRRFASSHTALPAAK